MEHTLNILKAASDGSRLRVILALTEHGELCVCEITEMLSLATATVSRHMSVLQRAGLVRSRKRGRWVYYGLSEEFPDLLLEWLKKNVANDSEVLKDRERLLGIIAGGEADSCKPSARGRESLQDRRQI